MFLCTCICNMYTYTQHTTVYLYSQDRWWLKTLNITIQVFHVWTVDSTKSIHTFTLVFLLIPQIPHLASLLVYTSFTAESGTRCFLLKLSKSEFTWNQENKPDYFKIQEHFSKWEKYSLVLCFLPFNKFHIFYSLRRKFKHRGVLIAVIFCRT